MQNNRIDLLTQWDADANLPLTPKTVTSGSNRKIWWVCEKGHKWQQEPWVRAAHQANCPICIGKKIVTGINDLKTMVPDVADEWNDKNGTLRPENISPYSHRKVWWKCRECGHEWLAQIKSRAGAQKCGCPACANRTIIPGQNDLATEYPEVAAAWHPTKNGTLSPQQVPSGTSRKVWWKCNVCGNEWEAAVSSRAHGSGCPVCAGKAVIAGVNDLKSLFPEIAGEWHPEKNGALKPDMVTAQSNRVVWWRDELGHEWRAQIASRIRGDGCPICANKKLLTGFNDLQTRYPEIAKEWDSGKNGTTPDKVLPTNRTVWWRCPNGHEYQCQIDTRAYQNSGCPVCAGRSVVAGENDLATLYPRLAKQWHPTKNGTLKPTMVTAASNKKVWWRCELGHEWKAMVISRSLKGTGCPVCAGKIVLVGFNDLASQEPKIAAQWHPTLNAPRTPEMYTCGSNQRIWWQCGEGHVWQAPIGRRYYQRSGCPVCAGNVGKKRLAKYERMMRETTAEQKRKITQNQ